MADIRIKDLATTAASTASDDFVAVDGSANGTRKLNAYSPTFGGNLTVSGTGTSSVAGGLNILSNSSATGSVDIGADARASNLRLSFNAAAGNDREIITYTAGLQRWKIAVNGTAESGSNAGSNWSLQAYADNGSTSLGNAISITRSTLATTFGGNLTVSGGTIDTAASTNLTLNAGSSGASLVIAQGANGGGTFTNKGTGYFTFNGPNFSNPDSGATVLIYSNDSAAIDKGGSLLFGGSYTGTTQTVFAGLAGRKENATAGNYAGYLQFYTGTQASALEEIARFTSSGNLLIGTTTDNGNKLRIASGSINLDDTYTLGWGNGTAYVQGSVAGNFVKIGTAGSVALTIDSSQNATFAGKVTANGAGSTFKGTATNDNAAAGYVGEYVSSTVAYAGRQALTTGTYLNVTSISLTAGDWDVDGTVLYEGTGATVTRYSGAVTSTSLTPDADADTFDARVGITTTTGNVGGYPTTMRRISISSTTTIYLIARGYFSAGTLEVYGRIQARRVR